MGGNALSKIQLLTMDYKIEDIEIEDRLAELKLTLPARLTFFPENFETVETQEGFIFSESVIDLNKVFRKNNIPADNLGSAPLKLRTRKYADWFGPTLFFSLTMLSENPTVVSLSLNVLSNYVTDFFKGSFGEKKARLEIYVETKRKKKIKKISYTGSPEGIRELEKIIKDLD